jgi:diguanylate cyclase (GGDEF)-like protein
VRRSHRQKLPLGIALFDVDHLRAYNEAEGHLDGDRVLRRIAETFASQVRRAGDLVARYNGGTFGVVFATPGDVEGFQAYCDTLRRGVEELDIGFTDTRGTPTRLTVSAGIVARVPGRGEPPDALVEPARQALSRAKAQGRNRIEAA